MSRSFFSLFSIPFSPFWFVSNRKFKLHFVQHEVRESEETLMCAMTPSADNGWERFLKVERVIQTFPVQLLTSSLNLYNCYVKTAHRRVKKALHVQIANIYQ